ncbi:uncharacterized protein J8A68_004200 [[Candida] subhashii]|uniref:K Homology domain-containing protein n=1 Tax=[Candida] subhashii TaxID=561895 RepID=A0A8J5QJP0_9ASCO|nr:uncharacterized protein J8A68_004200 [[Candida] subhashii]KAG7662306.1 hypothetical protein J8A68_004200 [[Candida] subhashii]
MVNTRSSDNELLISSDLIGNHNIVNKTVNSAFETKVESFIYACDAIDIRMNILPEDMNPRHINSDLTIIITSSPSLVALLTSLFSDGLIKSVLQNPQGAGQNSIETCNIECKKNLLNSRWEISLIGGWTIPPLANLFSHIINIDKEVCLCGSKGSVYDARLMCSLIISTPNGHLRLSKTKGIIDLCKCFLVKADDSPDSKSYKLVSTPIASIQQLQNQNMKPRSALEERGFQLGENVYKQTTYPTCESFTITLALKREEVTTLIGLQGSRLNSIRVQSRCLIKVLPAEQSFTSRKSTIQQIVISGHKSDVLIAVKEIEKVVIQVRNNDGRFI